MLLSRDEPAIHSVMQEISRSEATAHLYAKRLNQLTHERDGLAAASRIVAAANCFSMSRMEPVAMRKAAAIFIDI